MIKRLLILSSILLAPQVLAAPGQQVSRMMQTPASTFDMFLFRLYEAGKCNNVLKNNNSDEADLCLSSIRYDADKNILNSFFESCPAPRRWMIL